MDGSAVYFYWDDVASRRLSANQMDSNRALEAAKDPGEKRAGQGQVSVPAG